MPLPRRLQAEAHVVGFTSFRFPAQNGFEQSVDLLLPTQLQWELLQGRMAETLADSKRKREIVEGAPPFPVRPTTSSHPLLSILSEPDFVQQFEGDVARRMSRLKHFVLGGSELLRVIDRIKTMKDKDYQRRELELVDRLRKAGPLRLVANPGLTPLRWAKSLQFLRSAHPNFRKVTDFVEGRISLALTSTKPLAIPPLHLWGAPGLGKSHYAVDLADALRCPVRVHSMENAQTTALLLGGERHWANASPGTIFNMVLLGRHANPIVVLDEIDKASRRAQYDPLAPLHSLLEPFTARKVRDAALDIEFDASLVIYIATSNDPTRVPESLRSRFREFEIHRVLGEDALMSARTVAAAAVAKCGVPGFAKLEPRLAHKLAHLTPREIHQAVQDAIAHATEHGRQHVVAADLPAWADDEREEPRRLH
jgi:ATP-dependent Lon protease